MIKIWFEKCLNQTLHSKLYKQSRKFPHFLYAVILEFKRLTHCLYLLDDLISLLLSGSLKLCEPGASQEKDNQSMKNSKNKDVRRWNWKLILD